MAKSLPDLFEVLWAVLKALGIPWPIFMLATKLHLTRYRDHTRDIRGTASQSANNIVPRGLDKQLLF